MIDLIHTFLNLTLPPVSFFTLLLFFPPFQLFKYFLSFLGMLFPEDVAGKVVLITGASSGIGECVAYEYAKRGACLVLVARREKSLEEVAERARMLGSEVLTVRADVSKPEDCRRVVDDTMNHFGRLDHLVNNAGVMAVTLLEEVHDITDFRQVMDVNFWGSVYMTQFAIPYLRTSKGRIVAISSISSWLPEPRNSLYNASKAALHQFYETLRVEFGPDIGITIASLGVTESEYTQGKFINYEGKQVVDQDMRDVQVNIIPMQRVGSGAKAIVTSAVRGERYLTEPSWYKTTYFWKLLCPEVVEWVYRMMYIVRSGEPSTYAMGKRVADYTGAKGVLYPESVQQDTIKVD